MWAQSPQGCSRPGKTRGGRHRTGGHGPGRAASEETTATPGAPRSVCGGSSSREHAFPSRPTLRCGRNPPARHARPRRSHPPPTPAPGGPGRRPLGQRVGLPGRRSRTRAKAPLQGDTGSVSRSQRSALRRPSRSPGCGAAAPCPARLRSGRCPRGGPRTPSPRGPAAPLPSDAARGPAAPPPEPLAGLPGLRNRPDNAPSAARARPPASGIVTSAGGVAAARMRGAAQKRILRREARRVAAAALGGRAAAAIPRAPRGRLEPLADAG